MKKSLTVLLALALTLVLATCAWAAGPKIVMDGAELASDVAPFIEAERTMVPLRVIGENMNAVVHWDAGAKQVTVVQDEQNIVLKVDTKEALVNGETVELDAPAVVRNGRTFVPLRFVGETLGCTVDYKSGVVTVWSPEDGSLEYLLEVSEAYLDLETVAFTGEIDGKVSMTVNGVPVSEKMSGLMAGWIKQPNQVYLDMDLSAAGIDQNMKMYIDQTGFYMQAGEDQPWMAMEGLPQMPGMDMSNSALFTQSPERMIQMIKELGLVTRFAPDAQIDGQNCKVITYRMTKEQYLKALSIVMEELAALDPDAAAELEEAGLGEMAAMMGTMIGDFNVTCRTYISEETGLFVREEMKMQMTMNMLGESLEMVMNIRMDYTGYNVEVAPPDVSGAVAFSPEMIAEEVPEESAEAEEPEEAAPEEPAEAEEPEEETPAETPEAEEPAETEEA